MNGGTIVFVYGLLTDLRGLLLFNTITLSSKQQSTITLQSARQDKKIYELFSSSKRGTSERRILVQKAELLSLTSIKKQKHKVMISNYPIFGEH